MLHLDPQLASNTVANIADHIWSLSHWDNSTKLKAPTNPFPRLRFSAFARDLLRANSMAMPCNSVQLIKTRLRGNAAATGIIWTNNGRLTDNWGQLLYVTIPWSLTPAAHDFCVQAEVVFVIQRSQPMSWIIAPAARRERIFRNEVMSSQKIPFLWMEKMAGEPHGWHLGRCWFGLPGTRHCPWGQILGLRVKDKRSEPFVLVQAYWV